MMPAHFFLPGVLVLWLVVASEAAGRVVQLITDNPSPFAAADPNDPQYIVTLFDEERKPTELPQMQLLRSVLMTDAEGQRFNCSIPGAPSEFTSLAADLQQAPAQAPVPTRTPFELLDSLTGLCLYRQDGLWTYEVCHKKHVRQFRQAKLPPDSTALIKVPAGTSLEGVMQAVEAGDMAKALQELELLLGDDMPDTAKGKEDFSCGQYSGDDQQTEAILEDASSSGHHIKYVSHVYSGGADCLLTGSPRTAEVRYTCARDVKENVVLSVREFPTCNYVVVVSTPFLCKHPAFTPPVHDVRLISCLPIDDQGRAVIKELHALSAQSGAAAGGAAGGLAPLAAGQRDEPRPDRAAAAPALQPAAAPSSRSSEAGSPPKQPQEKPADSSHNEL